jgi:hypothetical protein
MVFPVYLCLWVNGTVKEVVVLLLHALENSNKLF